MIQVKLHRSHKFNYCVVQKIRSLNYNSKFIFQGLTLVATATIVVTVVVTMLLVVAVTIYRVRDDGGGSSSDNDDNGDYVVLLIPSLDVYEIYIS